MLSCVFGSFQQEKTNDDDDDNPCHCGSDDADKSADDDDDFLTASPASSTSDKIDDLELSFRLLQNSGKKNKSSKTNDAESKQAAENQELSDVLNDLLNGIEHADVSKSLDFDESESLTVDGVDIDNIVSSLESPDY